MFSLVITDTDDFLDLPISAQALYFHFGMRADDDGFVGSPRKIMRAIGFNKDDLSCLIAKGYVLPFESGIVVIRDWKINNTIQTDRYVPTIYQAEKKMLALDESKHYFLKPDGLDTFCIQDVSNTETQTRLDKAREEEGGASPHTLSLFDPPTMDDVLAQANVKGYGTDSAKTFFNYYQRQGWIASNGRQITDWKAALDNWQDRERTDRNKEGGHPNWVK